MSSCPNASVAALTAASPRLRIAQIGHVNRGADVGNSTYSGGDFIQLRGIARDEAKMHAFTRQFNRDRGADAATGARDQRDFSVEPEFHSTFLFAFSAHDLLDKHAGIGHKEQLFTGFRAANHNEHRRPWQVRVMTDAT